jgi:geranylgeranyl reductase family protein
MDFMERFDAIVVGAGPAGSTAALRLGRGGARVLMLDRERFPRDKPCGGGLTYRAVRQLPVAVDPVVEDVVDRFELGFRYRRRFERSGEGPLVLMTQRRRLDAFLAEQAVAAGVEFRDGVRATAVEAAEGVVRFDGKAAAAPVVIGADGVNGVCARMLGLAGSRRHGVALEGNVPYVHAREERWRGRAVVELGSVPGGYAWVFPKGDHANVGVGGWESEGPRLREHLDRACAEYGLPAARLEALRGYRLPMRRPGDAAAEGRVLLVGDAAGLVDPLSGDGIYEALVSARLAAESALAADLGSYEARLDSALGRTLAASWKAKLALERSPRLVYGIARLPLVWGFTAAFLRGDLGHPGEARGLVRAPLRLVEALGR